MQGHKFLVRSNSGTEGKSDFGVYDVTNGFPGTAVKTFTPFSGTCTTYGINMWVNIKKDSATQTTIVIYYRGLGVAKYTMKPKCSKPTANVNGGTYTSHQHITLSCATSGATIRYTTNGTEPTSSSTAYSSAINVTSNTRIRAKAFKSGFEASDEFDQTYTIDATLAPPTFSVASGTQFSSSGSVTITAPSGSTLHYSTDGGSSYTTASSNTATVTITEATTLNAYATQTDKTDSSVATASYTVKCATPTANVNGGSYTSWQFITLSCATTGATIRYTTDGSEPTASSTAYSSTITLKSTTRLRAKAFKSNCVASDEFDQTYNIDATLAAPTFSPATGTQFTSSGSVTITAPSGSTLHYSTDGGSSYTTASSNTATVTITEATTLKAYATQTDKTDSSIAEASYTVKCPTPSISPSTGTYPKAQSVTISCADAGATIYYTTDGSTPTTSSTAYSGTFTVSSTTTVKAIAVMSGCVNSDVASETITIKPQSAPATNIGISYSPVIGVSTNN
ncbi:MAG: chitobiase/beta-hexosaminidase C-terminal domain-containing protein, partial [Muribaculaceae bacterium]|nr:chitobiase/beta-hexosaminidase C-terminal domain-containing protein [Muribaculaceae bacterium]